MSIKSMESALFLDHKPGFEYDSPAQAVSSQFGNIEDGTKTDL